MKTPDEFIREDFLLRPVRNVDKLVFDGNDVKKLMEDYAAYMLEHAYVLKKLEAERITLRPLGEPLGGTPGSAWWDYWKSLEGKRWAAVMNGRDLPVVDPEFVDKLIGSNEEESE